METTMYHRTFCHRNIVCFLGTPQKDAQIPCHCLSSIYAYHVCSCFIIHIDWRDMSVYNIFYIHLYSIFYMWYIMIIYIYTYTYTHTYTYTSTYHHHRYTCVLIDRILWLSSKKDWWPKLWRAWRPRFHRVVSPGKCQQRHGIPWGTKQWIG